MAIQTEHYDLTAFQLGDVYSGSADKRRFTIVDNQLYFLAEQIGDGVISGWTIIQNGLGIRVLPGLGIIDAFFTVTYGNIDISLQNNRRIYVFMQRNPNVVAEIGPFCDVQSINYIDTTSPNAPVNLSSNAITYNSISLSWTANSEIDLSYYNIYRYKNTGGMSSSSSYSLYDTSQKNSYIDQELDQNSLYSYRISAVDLNGHESPMSLSINVYTLEDVRIPADPLGVNILTGNGTLQVYWGASNFLVNSYQVTIQEINLNGVNIGSQYSVNVSDTTFYYIFDGLENGQLYKITVYAVSHTGILSPGISDQGTPTYSGGASELSSISVSDFVLDSSYRIALNLSWELRDAEYIVPPNYYLVTVNRDGEIGVPSVYTNVSNTITGYTTTVSGQESSHDIVEETTYTIQIQTVTGDIKSNGFIIIYRTDKFSPPSPVSNLSIDTEYNINNRSIIISWDNSVSQFAYNSITIKRIPLDVSDEYTNEDTVILADNFNYGQGTVYILSKNDINNFCRYEVYVTTYDSYGNTSSTQGAATVINVNFPTTSVNGISITNSGQRPPVPTQQFANSNNDQVTIYWNAADSDYVNGYRLYRSLFHTGYLASDFILVADLPSNIRKFNDYSTSNGSRYVYFVTTVDVFGNESPNPSDGYIYYPLVYAAPRSHTDLTQAPVISITANGNDAILSWLTSDSNFDGYQIFRSESNDYSFVPVGSVGPLDNSFTDVGALKLDGQYYYMMRKFRNEATIYTSTSKLAPIGALILGLVSRNGSTITIDQSSLFNINLLVGPIKEEVHKELSVPTHLFYSTSDDRRIRLQNNLNVVDWLTQDYQNYTTTRDLSGTGNYIAYLDGIESPYNSVINVSTGTITFEQTIFDPTVNVGANPPAVTVIFLNIQEITGVLPANNVEQLSACKVTTGILDSSLIPQIDHLGRYKEQCIPSSSPLVNVNPQVYSGVTPSGLTFYDIVKTDDNRLVLATTAGVMVSSSLAANTLTTSIGTNYAASRIIYCPFLEMYFAALGPSVQISTDLINWQVPSGLESILFVRDLVSDEKGTVYASTDSGVYYIQPLSFTKLFWSQCPLFNPNDTNTYALAYDGTQLYASGTNGIFTSVDGLNWQQFTGNDIQVPVYYIYLYDRYIFAVTNNKVLRKRPSDISFKVIGEFSDVCRKGVYFAGDFYVTTDAGLYSSANNNDVLNDTTIEWSLAFQSMSRNGTMPATHALQYIDGRLWIGQDEMVYSITPDGILYTNFNISGICSTVYLNGLERNIGVFVSTGGNVAFDTKVDPAILVTIVSQYTFFTAINGGWADTKYDAGVLVGINGVNIVGPPVIKLINGKYFTFPPTPWMPPTDVTTISTAISAITTPDFNGRNSNYDKALASLTTVVQITDSILNITYLGEGTTVPSNLVASLFQELNRFKTYINPELRKLIKYPPITGTINYNGFTALFDVVAGTINITGGVDKYTKVTLTVMGVEITNIGSFTHEQIEDVFEEWNSGLTASMAAVQQSNLLKLGIYEQHYNPYAMRDGGFTYQSVHYGACDDWYDKLLSTIDYEQKLEQLPPTQGTLNFESVGFSIDYPADVLYVESLEEVWICGDGGIIAINATSYDTRKVFGSQFYFYNMCLSGGIVYTLAEDGIYTINTINGITTKDVDDIPPIGFTSIYVSGGTIYIGTENGVYSKRPFESSWTQQFSLSGAKIRSTSALTFAVGRPFIPSTLSSSSSSGLSSSSSSSAPMIVDTVDSVVYYSFSGVIWDRSENFTGITVNSATQQFNTIYYATNSGLLEENLSTLFLNSANFSGPSILATDLNDTGDGSSIVINDVDADNLRVIAGTDTGMWYSLSGEGVDGFGQSRLETIHKVKVINGQYWLFADNLIDIENMDRLIQLTTGRALY